jgi:hypothetical protein
MLTVEGVERLLAEREPCWWSKAGNVSDARPAFDCLLAEVARLRGVERERDRLRIAVEHYADETNWVRALTLDSEWYSYRWGGSPTSVAGLKGRYRLPWEVARAALGQESSP